MTDVSWSWRLNELGEYVELRIGGLCLGKQRRGCNITEVEERLVEVYGSVAC